MEFPQARLLVFAKAPVPGQVKTRLIPKLGPQGAAKLYKTLLRRTLGMVTTAPLCPVQLWCAPDARHSFFTLYRRDYGVTLHVQRGSDLGRRMAYALTSALRESESALVIGADCVSLNIADLQFALNALASGKDAVLGPTEDGGYALIGLGHSSPQIFKNIAWGSGKVLTATRRRLQRSGLNWTELPVGWDVDYPADVRRLKRENPSLFYPVHKRAR